MREFKLGFAKLSHLLSYLGEIRKEILLAAAVSAIVNVLMITPMLYMLQVFDRVMISKSEVTLIVLTAITLAFYATQAFAEWLRSRILSAAGVKLDRAISRPIFIALFKDKVANGATNPIQVFSDLQTIRQWLTGSGVHSLLDAPWTPLFVAIMFFLHPVLGWFCVLGICFLLSLAYFTSRSVSGMGDAVQDEEKELNKFLYTKMRNAELLEVHGMVTRFRNIWWKQQINFLNSQAVQQDIEERHTAFGKQARYLLNSLALAVGALLAIEGEITLGAMVAASLMMARATAPVDSFVSGWRSLHNAVDAYRRLDSLLLAYPPQSAVNDPVETRQAPVGPLRGHIALKSLSIQVPGRPSPLLEGVDIAIQPGELIALVGPSGSGKSTLVKSILGVWPHTKGQVLLDGQHWPSPQTEYWRAEVGYLPQEVELFGATLSENICRMGILEAQPIIEAAKTVGVHEIILRLPKGYESTLGEAGGHLSGGQLQRVALARAIYKNPKLLVLDEPNSNLDQRGENFLGELLMRFRAQTSTIIVVSHRPSILQIADKVLALQPGRVAYWGSAQDFLRQQPLST